MLRTGLCPVERADAVLASIRFIPRVNAFVVSPVTGLEERRITEPARVWAHPGVRSLMNGERGPVCKRGTAILAREWPLARVSPHVDGQA